MISNTLAHANYAGAGRFNMVGQRRPPCLMLVRKKDWLRVRDSGGEDRAYYVDSNGVCDACFYSVSLKPRVTASWACL